MRILDINGNELLEEDIDLKEGHLEPEQLFIAHHDTVPAVSRQTHFRVKEVFFSNSSYIPVSEQDPHIIVIDAKTGQFQYQNLESEEPKKARGMSLEEIVDREASKAIPAWDEYEDILRYILYTPAEKQAKEEEEEQARRREEFLNNGLARLEALESSNNIINTTIATQAANIVSLETTMTNSILDISQNITNIENAVTTVNSEITSVNDNLAIYAENLDSQSDNLSDLSAAVSNHGEALETQSLNFDLLQENVGLIDERVINAEEVMTVNTDEIHGIDDTLQVTNETVDDLVLTMADILGMNESEEEEEPVEE